MKRAVFDAITDVAMGMGNDLLTFMAVGSHADRDKPEGLHNDYDFLYVFEGLTWKRFQTLRCRLDEATAKVSLIDHRVYVDDRLGPIKPQGDTPKVSMVQPLVFDRESFAKYVAASPFITLDWSRFPVQFGRKLTSYAAIGFPTIDQLLDARAGIRHYRQMALEQTVSTLVPVNDGGMLGRAPAPVMVTTELLLELHHTIVTRTMTNTLMVIAHNNSGIKQMELVNTFLGHLPQLEHYRSLATMLVEQQERAREGKPVEFDPATAQIGSLAFLRDLEAICLKLSFR